MSELSAASGVGRPALYALLKRLEEAGEVVTEQLPGDKAGYRLAAASQAATSSPASARAAATASASFVTDRAARGSYGQASLEDRLAA